MSGLAFELLRALDKQKRDPTSLDRTTLDRLEKMARRSYDGAYVALQAPMAPETWEVVTDLPKAKEESGLAPLEFPRPVEIVGFYASIVPAAPLLVPVDPIPGLNDVLVSIQVDRKEQKTTRTDQRTGSASTDNWVTLGAMVVQPLRLLALCIGTPKPWIGFKFRWKQGANIFPDSIVSIACYARYYNEEER